MCFGCQCPEPLPPPTQTIANCRTYLQALAVGLMAIGLLGLACGQIFPFFFNFLLIYFLYIGWTTFNWCMVLGFFMFCTFQTVQSIIVFIGILQYGKLFADTYVTVSIYCLLMVIYYPVAVYVSHYCYKHFKHSFQGNQQFFMGGPPANNGGGQLVGAGGFGGRYQRMFDDRVDDQPAPRAQNQNNYFTGEGVRIG